MSAIETDYTQANDAGVATLRVRGTVTWVEAPQLREQLFGAIASDKAKRLSVDLSGVEQIDTAGLAVLIEGLMATRQRRPHVRLVTPSAAVERVFQLAGFVRLMSEHPDAAFYDALRKCCCDDAAAHREPG